MTASIVAQPASALAAEAAQGVPATRAGLAAKADAAGGKSQTVAKSGAQALLQALGAAPSGHEWRWVTDTAATTRTVVDRPAWTEDVTTWKTSDGKSFKTEAEARAHAREASVSVSVSGSETSGRTSDG